jgi:Calcineurin-like phosphoesterase
MIIAPLSDVHLECSWFHLPSTPDDVHNTTLVLAGDIGSVHIPESFAARYVPFVEAAASNFKYVVLVIGNHEHYYGRLHETIHLVKHGLSHLANVFILDNESVVLDGIAFVGSTMWTDCDRNNPHAPMLWRGMHDSDHILVQDVFDEHAMWATDSYRLWKEAHAYLMATVVERQQQGYPVVVVTHHAPTQLSVAPAFVGDSLNMFFHADMWNDVADLNPVLWIHGHMHNTCDYYIDKTLQWCQTRVVCNPRGYMGARGIEYTGFDPTLRIPIVPV